MIFDRHQFRHFYKHFVTVPITPSTEDYLEGFNVPEGANCILTYCDCEPVDGLILEVLAPAYENGSELWYGEGNPGISRYIVIQDHLDLDFGFVGDDGSIRRLFKDKLDAMAKYKAKDGVEKTRQIEGLDEYRYQAKIDQVMTVFVKGDLEPEYKFTRIVDYSFREGYHLFFGILMDDFDNPEMGYYKGDEMCCCYGEVDGEYVPYCDIDEFMDSDDYKPEGAAEDTEDLADFMRSIKDTDMYLPCKNFPDVPDGFYPMVDNAGDGELFVSFYLQGLESMMPEHDMVKCMKIIDIVDLVERNDHYIKVDGINLTYVDEDEGEKHLLFTRHDYHLIRKYCR